MHYTVRLFKLWRCFEKPSATTYWLTHLYVRRALVVNLSAIPFCTLICVTHNHDLCRTVPFTLSYYDLSVHDFKFNRLNSQPLSTKWYYSVFLFFCFMYNQTHCDNVKHKTHACILVELNKRKPLYIKLHSCMCIAQLFVNSEPIESFVFSIQDCRMLCKTCHCTKEPMAHMS